MEIDDFEFKPLTKGLGFHKKTIDLEQEMQKSQSAKSLTIEKTIPKNSPYTLSEVRSEQAVESAQKIMNKFPVFDPLEPEAPKATLTPPLPRTDGFQQPIFKSPRFHDNNLSIEPTVPAAITPIAPAISAQIDFTENKSNKISSEPLPLALTEVSFSVAAFVFDLFLVVGLTFLFTGTVLAITGADLSLVLANAKVDLATRLSLALLLLSVIQLYVVLARSFFGRTVGEWTFDMQLGNSHQQKASWYPIVVAWRAFVVTITGFITLPILSLIARRDLTYYLTGLKLYRHH